MTLDILLPSLCGGLYLHGVLLHVYMKNNMMYGGSHEMLRTTFSSSRGHLKVTKF